jgi:PAS domain S-box-containing protein
MTGHISVLYVDDEPDLLTLGKIFLERTGNFIVTTVPGAQKALDLITHQDFDAIVSDYQMPEMDGIEFLKHLKSTGNPTPFILFTGKGREEVVIEALNNGADFYLQKGGDPKAQFVELVNKILHATSRRRAEIQVLELKQRESDIINFLPDATFAINTNHEVIAWNRAMEQLSGIFATEIIGKGDYAYSIPFYQKKRPMLIDLVLDCNPEIIEKYPGVKREDQNLMTEINRPWIHEGKEIFFWITACPLYNTQGTIIGAIESLRDITSLKKARELLEESESRYRLTLDASNEGIWDWNLKTGSAFFSPHWYTMLGYEPDEFPASYEALQSLLHPEDLDRAKTSIEDHLNRKNDGYSIEFRLKTKSGDWKWILARGRIIEWDDSNLPVRMVGTHTDITSLKHTEEKLRLDESRLETLLTLTLMTQKPVRDITDFALEEAVRLTESAIGYVAFLNEDETILTMHAWSHVAMEECQVQYRTIEYTVADTGLWGEPVRQRRPVITNDYSTPDPLKKGTPAGHVSIIRHLGVPIFDKNRIVMLVGVANKPGDYGAEDIRQLTLLMAGVWNIVQRKNADEAVLRSNEELSAAYEELSATEEELRTQYNITTQSIEHIRHSENQLRILVENLLDPVIIIGFDSRILYGNPAAFTFFELDRTNKGPFHIQSFLSAESWNKASADLIEIQKTGGPVVDEYDILTSNGKVRTIEAAGHLIYWDGQDADLVSIRDITDRKGDKDALVRANRKLTILSSITRHDILNQVTGLLGYLELLYDTVPEDPQHMYIQKCLDFTNTIESQIGFTKLVDEIRSNSLSWQYTERMVTHVLHGFAIGEITCQVDLNGLYLYADPILEKVIFTLIENSIRHGGQVSHIHFSFQIVHDTCIFLYEDDGSGIPVDEKEKIFQQGYGKHTGLGLFLVREILAINNMEIIETGTPGKGARFEIHIPSGKWRIN